MEKPRPWEVSQRWTGQEQDTAGTVPVKEKGRDSAHVEGAGHGLPCEDPCRNNNRGPTSHPSLISSRYRPFPLRRHLQTRPEPDLRADWPAGGSGAQQTLRNPVLLETLGREAAPPGPRSRVWADRSKVPRKTPAGGWPGSVSKCLCNGSACHPAWGSLWGLPDPPEWRLAAGWAVPAGCTRSTRDSDGQRGALSRSTQGEHSGGELRRVPRLLPSHIFLGFRTPIACK